MDETELNNRCPNYTKWCKLEGMKFQKQQGSIAIVILDFVQSIVLALSVFVLLYLFIAQPNEVKGSSMFPTYEDKQLLLTDKLSYRFSDPKRGDVIVFKAPPSEPCAEDECEYIKRVVGVPGDRVKVMGGKVYVNGSALDESSYLSESVVSSSGSFLQEGVERVVPTGQYLPLGDNRPHSRDGREFGPIPVDLIVGKAFFRYWPVSALGLVPKAKY